MNSFYERLGKEAAVTGRAETMPARTPEEREAAVAATKKPAKPMAQTLPTRYGRKLPRPNETPRED